MNLRFLTNLAVLLTAATSATMAQQKMVVHIKGGQEVSYDIDKVEYVEVIAPSATSQSPTAEGVGGVIGNAVNMGLSVQWADVNLGAEYPTDDGTRCTWAEAQTLAAKWGDGWRLPTDREWQELYNKCQWRWEVRDGIGGRLITSDEGTSIFIPATGVSFDDNVQIRGCIGIYWTEDASEDAPGVPGSAVGAYFDSANIYRIDYPRTNKFSVRLVK